MVQQAKKSQRKELQLKFSVPKGMKDILPDEYRYWEMAEAAIKKFAGAFGFQYIETPMLEDARLFEKGTGASTDIVQKEMFNLATKGGDKLALRPESTPSIARAYIENGMANWQQPVKLCSYGPMFRYERPQMGRKREFRQFGFEILGEQNPVIDAELVYFAWKVFSKLGITDISAQINSIGCNKCRKDYRNILLSYFKSRKGELCKDCAERLSINPLRILDCKNKDCQGIIGEAPQTVDYLCKECHDHLMLVLEYLDELEIPYFLNSKLVRGLDYYTKTVFEFWYEKEEFKDLKMSLCSGGRYDELVKLLGGKETPAAGMAFGMDRIVMILEGQKTNLPKKPNPKVFIVALGTVGKKKGLKVFDSFINSGIAAGEALSKESLKAQLKAADKENAQLSLIIGQKEALDETVIIRDMASGTQEIVRIDNVVSEVKRMLKNI